MTNNPAAESDEIVLPWWAPIWEFLIHAIVGTILFLLVALPAIAVDFLNQSIEAKLPLSPVPLMLSIVEYLILASDVFLFSVFLVRSTYRALKAL